MSSKLYFKNGKLLVEVGDVRIYEMDGFLFLEIGRGHDLWALENEYEVYMDHFLKNPPFGECLEIGLGLSVTSRCILNNSKVINLTTIEINRNVIDAYFLYNFYLNKKKYKWPYYNKDKHIIINQDGLTYLTTTSKKYDYIFLDFYKLIDEESLVLIKDMVNSSKLVLNKGGRICGWLDPYTPKEFYKEFLNIFK